MKNIKITGAMFWGSRMRKVITIIFALALLMVIAPLPMRCQFYTPPLSLAPAPAHWDFGGGFIEPSTPPPPPSTPPIYKCYSFFNPGFWTGEVRLYWPLFSDWQLQPSVVDVIEMHFSILPTTP